MRLEGVPPPGGSGGGRVSRRQPKQGLTGLEEGAIPVRPRELGYEKNRSRLRARKSL